MSEPIAAIASGGTHSVFGIIRMSGEGCFTICDKVFQANNGKPFSQQNPRELVVGLLLDSQSRPIDQVLAVRFPGPHSFTGEDYAEFQCHGSPVVMDEVLRALFAAGMRQAGRGEFTKRAFLNGHLDLTQAEAVVDLIESETAAAARNAVAQLEGALRQKIGPVYDSLLDITSRFYAVVDYPDEDIEDVQREDIARTLTAAERELTCLLASFRRGRVLRQGVPTAIVGRPNVGKSSLLNALLGYDRAIVTDIAGTTRDTVEEKAVVGGVLLRLIDTAGIRDTGDTVERLGVERARLAASKAALSLLVLDGSEELTDGDEVAAQASVQAGSQIVLVNKADLPQKVDLAALRSRFACVLPVSAKEGTGLEALEAAVAGLFPAGEPGQLLTNARQAEAVGRAVDALRGAREALESGMTPDAVLTDTEGALHALGELTGRTLREDMVARIFERFCVGK